MGVEEIVARLREARAEFDDIEVKLGTGGIPGSVAETMCAFANSRGGTVIVGLDERDGFVAVGVPDAPSMRDAVVTMARDKLTPPLTPSVHVAPFEGISLVVAEVAALPEVQRPCFVTTRGLYNGAFVRVGAGDHTLTGYKIDRMRENSGQPRWDEEAVPGASIEDLERSSALRLIEVARSRAPRAFSGIEEVEALARLGVLVWDRDKLIPSIAGLLSLGVYPQQFFPQLIVTVVAYPREAGPESERFLDSAALGGSIPELVTEALHVVRRNMRVASRIVGAGRLDLRDIASEVAREAIVNALMHRDYSPQARGTQVQVELYADRMIVTSPGGLFGNVRLESLGLARTSSSRNARLAALLQDVGDPLTGLPVAENRGSGVSMMIDQVRGNTGAVPVFDANLDQFQVIIPRVSPLSAKVRRWLDGFPLPTAMTTEQQVAVAMAAQGYDVDTTTLDRLGLDQVSARRQLGELVDAGLLRSRRARDRGPYRLGVDPPAESGRSAGFLGALVAPEWGELGAEILHVLEGSEAMSREEIQNTTGAGRSSVVNALAELLDAGAIAATAPPHSPNRRYQLI